MEFIASKSGLTWKGGLVIVDQIPVDEFCCQACIIRTFAVFVCVEGDLNIFFSLHLPDRGFVH